jgi:hypothetical protein
VAARNPGRRGSRKNAYEQLSFDFGDISPPPPTVEIPRSNTNPAARAGSRRVLSKETSDAIQLAKDGDDFDLLPYQPTPSINPPRPRTLAAGYDKDAQTLRVRFRNGQVYGYYNVPPNVWRNFKRVKSPGRAINRTLNNFSYAPEHDLDEPTGVN